MANATPREPSARALQGARTRERILEAARRQLAEEGAERFTTRRVAERAGVSHGMCHYHFRDKRDLVLALLVHARRDWIEPLEELVDGPGSPDARMRAVISWMAEPATEEAIRVHTAIRAAAMGQHPVQAARAASSDRRSPVEVEDLGDELLAASSFEQDAPLRVDPDRSSAADRHARVHVHDVQLVRDRVGSRHHQLLLAIRSRRQRGM